MFESKNGIVKCPARFYLWEDKKWILESGRNDIFYEKTNDKSLKFGDKIQESK